jgi:hypothetical protein
MTMDIQRPSNARVKKTRRIVYVAVAVVSLAGVSYGVSRLRPAAPTVDRATIWTDEVKRGPMLREVHGLGTLVPEEIRWIPAQTDSRVDRVLIHPGATVQPDSVILELTNPELQRDVLDAEYQLKAAQADYENLRVQVNSDLLNQKAATAMVRSDYAQAKIQHEVDDKLHAQGLAADVTEQLSKVRMEQLAIRLQLEEEPLMLRTPPKRDSRPNSLMSISNTLSTTSVAAKPMPFMFGPAFRAFSNSFRSKSASTSPRAPIWLVSPILKNSRLKSRLQKLKHATSPSARKLPWTLATVSSTVMSPASILPCKMVLSLSMSNSQTRFPSALAPTSVSMAPSSSKT